MSVKKLELEFSLLPAAYYQKPPYKFNSYYYPFLTEERPLQTTVEASGLSILRAPTIDNDECIYSEASVVEIQVNNTKFFTDNHQEEEQLLYSKSEVTELEVNTVKYFKDHNQEEPDLLYSEASVMELQVDAVYFTIEQQQELEQLMYSEASVTHIQVNEV